MRYHHPQHGRREPRGLFGKIVVGLMLTVFIAVMTGVGLQLRSSGASWFIAVLPMALSLLGLRSLIRLFVTRRVASQADPRAGGVSARFCGACGRPAGAGEAVCPGCGGRVREG